VAYASPRRLSRPWLALVVALFCFPLFVGLGRTDVGHDEAIYSFGVDRILETGEWLVPRSSPAEDAPFLEKPPLKFWIVAAPIRLGLLPHDELGLRLWDALFGAIAFLYVFAIGSRLAGPICGAAAVLLLFVHEPLLFEHGLRSNNMEAPLFLCYCGGVYHYMRWAAAHHGRGTRHACVVALFFVLGFMTKFVAALFLPPILLVASLPFRAVRARLAADGRDWAKASALAAALIAPWFAYAHWRFGSLLWETMLAEHVYRRFTVYLDPTHLQPWHYYLTEMDRWFGMTGSAWLVLLGLVLLLVETLRGRSFEGALVLGWLVLPLAVMSAGTSKIYHYVYPFVVPAAIGGGFLAALAVQHTPVTLSRILHLLHRRLIRRPDWPRPVGARRALVVVAALALAIAAVRVVWGPVRLEIGDTVLFRSSGLLRPLAVALIFGVLAGAIDVTSRSVVGLLVAAVLPLAAYRATLPKLVIERRPMASAVECLQRVEARDPTAARGLYVDVPPVEMSHPLNYYFRRIRPWVRAEGSPVEDLARWLADPAEQRPVLVSDTVYQAFRRAGHAAPSRPVSPAMANFPNVSLLLPGPFASCGATGPAAGGHAGGRAAPGAPPAA
jgi:4-amino-4-deoxy-L-arabinose transferase-like glycosyltransferase